MDNPTNVGKLAIRFFENGTGYGFLNNQPGIEPVIYLNRVLLSENPLSPKFQQVYSTLLAHYHSLNIWEFVFPFTRFYEDITDLEPANAEIIILGKFRRAEAHCKVCEAKVLGYRLIG